MRLIFTSMNPAYVFSVYDVKADTLTHFDAPLKVKSGEDRPFGITWDADHLYVAVPRKILVFNRSLTYQGVLLDGLTPGIHQILYHDQKLWMVSPRLNAVKIYSFQDQSLKYFLPEEGVVQKWKPEQTPIPGRTKYLYDKHHYNSILIRNKKLYLNAHNFDRPSFISVYDYPSLAFRRKIVTGHQTHGLAWDKRLFTLDSNGTRKVLTTEGEEFDIGADKGSYVRGLAMTKKTLFVTHFPFSADRKTRRKGDSQLTILDRPTGDCRTITLTGVGNVNDLRLLDLYDLAHFRPTFVEFS